jgi:hypothetical protein
MVAKYGNDPLDCDVAPTSAQVTTLQDQLDVVIPPGQESAYASCAESVRGDPEGIPACVAAYKQSAIDRCKEKCLNHGGLNLSPKTGTMNCTSGVTFNVSGGVAPYHWSASKGVMTPSGAKSESAVLSAPANTGSAVAGTAYIKAVVGCQPGPSCVFIWDTYNCAGVQTATGNSTIASSPLVCNGGNLNTFDVPMCPGVHVPPCNCSGVAPGPVTGCSASGGTVCDQRTAPMISSGCSPCAISMAGTTTVSVTDSAGHSATAVITG